MQDHELLTDFINTVSECETQGKELSISGISDKFYHIYSDTDNFFAEYLAELTEDGDEVCYSFDDATIIGIDERNQAVEVEVIGYDEVNDTEYPNRRFIIQFANEDIIKAFRDVANTEDSKIHSFFILNDSFCLNYFNDNKNLNNLVGTFGDVRHCSPSVEVVGKQAKPKM